MAKVDSACFVCTRVPEESTTDHKLVSGCQECSPKEFFILLQRALTLDLDDDDDFSSRAHFEFIHKQTFCKSCLDILEELHDVLVAMDRLEKIVERQNRVQEQSKFLESELLDSVKSLKAMKERLQEEMESKYNDRYVWRTRGGHESQANSNSNPSDHPQVEIESKSQISAGLWLTAKTDLSKTPGHPGDYKKLVRSTTTTTNLSHSQPRTTIPSTSPTSLALDLTTTHLQINRSPVPVVGNGTETPKFPKWKSRIQNTHILHLHTNGESGVPNISNENGHEAKPPNDPSVTRNKFQTQLIPGSNEKKYECPSCPVWFTTKSLLESHVRSHTGEKPFICEICSMKFSKSSNLNAHGKVHTGEKPYSCKICSTAFAQLGNLNVHMRKHTGEKPYKCTFCSKEFAQRSNLTAHKKVHHPNEYLNMKNKI